MPSGPQKGHVEIHLDGLGFGKVLIDGREVPELISVSFDSMSPGELPVVNLRVLASSLNVVFDQANVNITEYDPSTMDMAEPAPEPSPKEIQTLDGTTRQVEVYE